MNRTTRFFVEFLAPGSFVAETHRVEVPRLDPYAVEWPKSAFAFTLYERTNIEIDGEIFKGEEKRVGPVYYHPDSKVESLEEVERNPNATKILLDNMRINGWTHIVWSRYGHWPQPFEVGKHEVLEKVR